MGDLGILGVIAFYKLISAYLRKAAALKKQFVDDKPSGNLFNAVIVGTIVRLALGMASHSFSIFFWYMLAGVVVVAARHARNMPETR